MARLPIRPFLMRALSDADAAPSSRVVWSPAPHGRIRPAIGAHDRKLGLLRIGTRFLRSLRRFQARRCEVTPNGSSRRIPTARPATRLGMALRITSRAISFDSRRKFLSLIRSARGDGSRFPAVTISSQGARRRSAVARAGARFDAARSRAVVRAADSLSNCAIFGEAAAMPDGDY